DRLEIDHRQVAAAFETAVRVEHVGDAARHAGGKVAPGRTDHDHHAARHVFATVVAGTLHHRDRPGIAHREALAGDAAEIALAHERAVEHGGADDDALLGNDAGGRVGPHDEAAARETLADVVIGFADEIEGEPVRRPRPEALPGGAAEGEPDRILGQPGMAVA